MLHCLRSSDLRKTETRSAEVMQRRGTSRHVFFSAISLAAFLVRVGSRPAGWIQLKLAQPFPCIPFLVMRLIHDNDLILLKIWQYWDADGQQYDCLYCRAVRMVLCYSTLDSKGMVILEARGLVHTIKQSRNMCIHDELFCQRGCPYCKA